MAIDWRPKLNFAIAGIDLAALPKNPTGVCIISKEISFFTLYKDEEIIEVIEEAMPKIVAIDAPLMEEIRVRQADKMLKKYGAMPPTMASMQKLVKRANRLVKKIMFDVIEVFPTASAKILGIYDKNWRRMAARVSIEVKNKHELDAYLAAYTAYLYLHGKAEKIGEGIVIPKVF